MKGTKGNYTSQPSKDFPLDAEGLAAIQTNAAMAAILGNIAGDRAILLGCEPSGGGASRGEGYLFLRTADHPEGEVVYFEGGATAPGMYLKKEAVAISAYGVDYPQAYTARSLAPGTGAEQYSWADFAPVATNAALSALIAAQAAQIALLVPPPLGVVQLFAGSAAPAGYAMCDGGQLPIADYPALYAAIGATFNAAPSASGSIYSTPAGYFRLPDLRGRFIVGCHPADADYSDVAKAGGKKLHALTAAELPPHAHPAPTGKFVTTTGGVTPGGGGDSGRNCLQNGTVGLPAETGTSAGGGAAHENRPPYYALAYIMKTQ
jgi:microcystin-dependent protein